MNNFLDALHWLIWGFVFGYFCHPIWVLCQKIWHEAKKAKEEWRNPR